MSPTELVDGLLAGLAEAGFPNGCPSPFARNQQRVRATACLPWMSNWFSATFYFLKFDNDPAVLSLVFGQCGPILISVRL